MLRAEVLDGEAIPKSSCGPVVIGNVAAAGGRRADHVARGDWEIEVPVELQRDAQSMLAKGALRIRQSDFGITPFSVGGGAIQVADEVDVRFEIVAIAR